MFSLRRLKETPPEAGGAERRETEGVQAGGRLEQGLRSGRGAVRAKLVGDLVEGVVQAVANEAGRGDDGDADQSSDQAVFDGGGALFIHQETLQHVTLSVYRCSSRARGSAAPDTQPRRKGAYTSLVKPSASRSAYFSIKYKFAFDDCVQFVMRFRERLWRSRKIIRAQSW